MMLGLGLKNIVKKGKNEQPGACHSHGHGGSGCACGSNDGCLNTTDNQ